LQVLIVESILVPLQPIVNLFAGLRRFLWLAIAQRFADAGKVYEANPMAVHLCGMNMIYEVMKNGGISTVILPSSAVQSMSFGGLAGITALAGQQATAE
jgi:hypothetical protein